MANKKNTDYLRCDECGTFDYQDKDTPFRTFDDKVICQRCIDFYNTTPPMQEFMWMAEAWLSKLEKMIEGQHIKLANLKAFKENDLPVCDYRFSHEDWDSRIEKINAYLKDRYRMHTWAMQLYKILRQYEMELSADAFVKEFIKKHN